MKLLLTTSRKPPLRVRQFIKEFSFLFPINYIQKYNRGKKSLQELFTYAYPNYQRIVIVSSKFGNPEKLIGYSKKDDTFTWVFEIKIKSIKLSFESLFFNPEYPQKTILSFQNVPDELTDLFESFFEELTKSEAKNNNIVEFLLRYTSKGYELKFYDSKMQQISPEIQINEIMIKDQDKKED